MSVNYKSILRRIPPIFFAAIYMVLMSLPAGAADNAHTFYSEFISRLESNQIKTVELKGHALKYASRIPSRFGMSLRVEGPALRGGIANFVHDDHHLP